MSESQIQLGDLSDDERRLYVLSFAWIDDDAAYELARRDIAGKQVAEMHEEANRQFYELFKSTFPRHQSMTYANWRAMYESVTPEEFGTALDVARIIRRHLQDSQAGSDRQEAIGKLIETVKRKHPKYTPLLQAFSVLQDAPLELPVDWNTLDDASKAEIADKLSLDWLRSLLKGNQSRFVNPKGMTPDAHITLIVKGAMKVLRKRNFNEREHPNAQLRLDVVSELLDLLFGGARFTGTIENTLADAVQKRLRKPRREKTVPLDEDRSAILHIRETSGADETDERLNALETAIPGITAQLRSGEADSLSELAEKLGLSKSTIYEKLAPVRRKYWYAK